MDDEEQKLLQRGDSGTRVHGAKKTSLTLELYRTGREIRIIIEFMTRL